MADLCEGGNEPPGSLKGKIQCVNLMTYDLFSRLIFSDEATFHTSGKINKHNCRVWGTQKPHRIIEH
ncbi:hypothetical protein ANN_22062 [Periplaneta americana]|uniref:Uncharacterized protein n=1 Tax=Periplaneta americana TaxID=6978 RepID=A0ABQ8S7C1_PERAM|nr:hypothetical protein ANN_22062 [Periplaneta americana]